MRKIGLSCAAGRRKGTVKSFLVGGGPPKSIITGRTVADRGDVREVRRGGFVRDLVNGGTKTDGGDPRR